MIIKIIIIDILMINILNIDFRLIKQSISKMNENESNEWKLVKWIIDAMNTLKLMSSWHHHLLCVLQSFNLVVLLLDLELQCLPLVGKGQPLLSEKKYVWNDLISIKIALYYFTKNIHRREKDFLFSYHSMSIILVYL